MNVPSYPVNKPLSLLLVPYDSFAGVEEILSYLDNARVAYAEYLFDAWRDGDRARAFHRVQTFNKVAQNGNRGGGRVRAVLSRKKASCSAGPSWKGHIFLVVGGEI